MDPTKPFTHLLVPDGFCCPDNVLFPVSVISLFNP